MSDNKQVSSLDEDFEKFKEWWYTLNSFAIYPEIVFPYFERYLKPQWQSQQKGGITQLDISKLMVESKYPLPVTKDDVNVYVVDIPKASKQIFNLISKSQQKETKPEKRIAYFEWIESSDSKHGWEILNKVFIEGTPVPDDYYVVKILEQDKFGNIIRAEMSNSILNQPQQKETKPTGLRWVKATEDNLPPLNSVVHIKTTIKHSGKQYKGAMWYNEKTKRFEDSDSFFRLTEQEIEWLDESGETEETKPVEDKAEKKYSYKITEHESYIIAYKVGTFEERTIAICDNAEKADFICKALNLCSNNPELLETPKPVSEEGCKHLTVIPISFGYVQCQDCGWYKKVSNQI